MIASENWLLLVLAFQMIAPTVSHTIFNEPSLLDLEHRVYNALSSVWWSSWLGLHLTSDSSHGSKFITSSEKNEAAFYPSRI